MAESLQSTLQGALLGIAAAWIFDLIKQRLTLKWKAQYDRELEEVRLTYSQNVELLKNFLGTERDALMAIRGILSNMISSTHGRTLEAIEQVWTNILRIRDFALQYIGLYELFTREELRRDDIAQELLDLIPLLREDQWMKEVRAATGDIEMYRPFIGERLWVLYSCYKAVALRIAWKVLEGKRHGRIPQWDETLAGKPDDRLRWLAGVVLSESELHEVFEPTPFGGPWRLLAAIEAKILEEMNLLVFGRRQVSMSIREMEQLERALHSVGADRLRQRNTHS